MRYPRAGTLDWMAMEEGAGILLDAVEDQHPYVHLTAAMSVGPVMALPLIGEWGPRGVIVVGRVEARPRFTEAELDLAGGFAAQAALALELADARADQQRLTVLEDRNRIARDLHDHVIQRLYASGLSLQSALATPRDEQLNGLLTRTVADLGDTDPADPYVDLRPHRLGPRPPRAARRRPRRRPPRRCRSADQPPGQLRRAGRHRGRRRDGRRPHRGGQRGR